MPHACTQKFRIFFLYNIVDYQGMGVVSAFRNAEKARRLSLPHVVYSWRRRPSCFVQSIASVMIIAVEDQAHI